MSKCGFLDTFGYVGTVQSAPAGVGRGFLLL